MVDIDLRQQYMIRSRFQLSAPQTWGVITRYSCTSACTHCLLGCSPSETQEIPEALLERFIEEAAKRKIHGGIVESGGEPMLNPEQVFRTVRAAAEVGLSVGLGSTYMGDTLEQIEENAERLKKAGLKTLWGSLDAFHQESHPQSIKMPYAEYQAAIFSAFAKRGISLYIHSSAHPRNFDQTREVGNKVLYDMLKIDDFKPSALFPSNFFLGSKNGTQVTMIIDDVIGIGRARETGFTWGKRDRLDYSCPSTFQMEGGTLTLFPDGSLAMCCSVERGANFSLGNLNDTSFSEVFDRIIFNPFLNTAHQYRLEAAHKVLEEEFPELLPKNGVHIACEICSPVVTHKEVQQRLRKNTVLFRDCFRE
jgi:hypothetical protein